jgi:hypothetical protein
MGLRNNFYAPALTHAHGQKKLDREELAKGEKGRKSKECSFW